MRDSVRPLWWLSVVCLLCSVALAAKKGTVRGLPVGTTASAEYGAFVKLARCAPSADQRQAVESLFGQLKERRITIKPSLCKLLALADGEQLIALCKKTALFFSHVDNTRVKNSGCLSSMIQSKKHINGFIGQEDTAIAMLAASPRLSSVTSMCHSKGVPATGSLKNLFSWPIWQVNGEFRDCLLYTSPSPRDRQKSRMPSSA